MSYPLFHAPAVDRAAVRYSAADTELLRRTGKRMIDHTEDDVLLLAPDLCADLNVFPCACGCGKAGIVYDRGWRHTRNTDT